jgi:hypothetical protein
MQVNCFILSCVWRRFLKNIPSLCDEVTGCFCEFGFNIIYDIIVMILLIIWMITGELCLLYLRNVLDPDPLGLIRILSGMWIRIQEIKLTHNNGRKNCHVLMSQMFS